ncbi:MAG: HAMP domain-containing histidine kinase, partial [Akkermansia sp.]|nr:HAMP domain-containing histidine kinase [Akkermansia sp.]
ILAVYARLERRRSDFVSAVTHELRTPLTSFQMMTEMLANGQVPADKVDEYHDNLHRESKRLAHLVENVLAFARLTRGKVRGRQDAAPCRQLLSGVFEKTAERLRAAGFKVTVTQDAKTELLSLRTDLLSLEQIFTNLADNTVKYAGSVNTPAVTISTMRSHRSILIRFADNGPGMRDEVRRRLFQPFSHTAQPGKPGIGLGLALSRDIARSIGGELSLEKSTSQGTSFILTLPLGE